MREFLEFVQAWAKHIAGVFSEYTIAAAIVTLVAVAVFGTIEHKWGSDWATRTLNFLVVLVGWSIVVPIVGFTLKAIGVLGSGLAFVYENYSSQPVAVLIIVALAATVFPVWRWRRPHRPPTLIKVLCCAAVGFVAIAITVPIVNLINPPPMPQSSQKKVDK